MARAQELVKSVRKRHLSLRIEHLRRLAQSRSEIDVLIDRERDRAIFRRLQSKASVETMVARERSRAVFRRLREALPTKSRRPLLMVQD